MTPDERHCVECLRWHEDRLSKLLQILGGAKFVARRDDDMFRGFYREIKRDLKDECAAGAAKGVAQSQPERVWLQQPLSEAHTALVASPTVSDRAPVARRRPRGAWQGSRWARAVEAALGPCREPGRRLGLRSTPVCVKGGAKLDHRGGGKLDH